MKTPHCIISLLTSSFFLHASSLYLGDARRHPWLRGSQERTSENSIATEGHDLDRATDRGAIFANGSSGKSGSFINCIFEFRESSKPEYTCDHSRDVEITWHEKNGRLMGTFTTNFHCPKRRRAIDRIRRYEIVGKSNGVTSRKRRTVYRGNAEEEEDFQYEDEEHFDGRKNVVPETSRRQSEDDTVAESQVAPPDVDDGLAAGDEKEPPADEVENDEGEAEGQKQVNEVADTPSEKEPTKDKDVADKEVPATEAPQETGVVGEKPPIVDTTEDVDDEDREEKPIFVIEIALDQLMPDPETVADFLADIGTIIYETGDYIISLILGNLKRRLHVARINDKFDEKVDKLAKSYGGDTAKALRVMEKRINKSLGKRYEFEIIKLMKDLRDGLKE